MASASTCWVLITRRRAILHMCCRLAMLRGHSQKCTLPSRVLKHKSKGEKTENWANISESSKCSKVVQGSWGKKWWGFLIESQDVPRCSLTSNVCVCVNRASSTCCGILPSSKDTSLSREGTAEAIRDRGNRQRSPFLNAPEANQPM